MHALFSVSLPSAEQEQLGLPYARYTRQLSFNVIRVDENKVLNFLFQSILCFFPGGGMGKDIQTAMIQTK